LPDGGGLMQIFTGDAEVPEALRRGVVAIGNFDGVHRGHQSLLATARTAAATAASPFGVLTFEPHPRALFRPDQPVFRLTTPSLKSRLIAALGADFMAVLEFNRELAALEAHDFVHRILIGRLGVSHVVTGFDFHFGHGRKGSPETMRRLGAELGFSVSTIDQVTDDDGLAPFSSSAIRGDLRHGRVGDAAHALGYWWMVSGAVVEGDRRGRAMGFPTANIVLDRGVEPLEGIYAVRVRLRGESHRGAAYVGTRPTFDTGRRFLEVFLLDFDRDIYGETIDVEFQGFIRDDVKFPTAAALIERMRIDCAEADALLRAIETHDPMRKFPLGALQAEGRI
jgi:riboflavin kinase / FMN adenylyltransferase